MTPLIASSSPGAVTSNSRNAHRVCAVDSMPRASKRLPIVPAVSSSARMPLPARTSVRAVTDRSPAISLNTPLSPPALYVLVLMGEFHHRFAVNQRRVDAERDLQQAGLPRAQDAMDQQEQCQTQEI